MSASQDASVEYGQLKINIYDFFPLGAFDCFLTIAILFTNKAVADILVEKKNQFLL